MTGPRGWIERFFGPAALEPMVACRIAFGALLFAAYATRGPWIDVLYGPAGMGGMEVSSRFGGAGFGRPLDAPFEWLLGTADSLAFVYFAWALLLFASLCFMFGYRTRLMGAIALLLHAGFVARNQFAYHGWAWMAKPFILYVLLAPSGAWVGIDAWRRARGRPVPNSIPSSIPVSNYIGTGWPLRLLKLHVCTMYAVAGLARLEDSSWRGGEMVFAAATDRYFARFDIDWQPFAALLEPFSYVAFVAEPLAPIALLVPGLGTAWAVLLLALHAGLEVIVRVGWWQWLMMSALLAFLPPTWLARPLGAIDRAGQRLFRPPTPPT